MKEHSIICESTMETRPTTTRVDAITFLKSIKSKIDDKKVSKLNKHFTEKVSHQVLYQAVTQSTNEYLHHTVYKSIIKEFKHFI